MPVRESITRWQKEHPERVSEYKKAYAKSKRCKLWWKNYRKTSKHKEWSRRYRQTESYKAWRSAYRKSQRKLPQVKTLNNLRRRLYGLVKRQSTGMGARSLLGCSLDDFKIYLESKFETGMNWNNYGNRTGQWSIDHIIPCAIFDLTKPEHQRRCFHFSNMQPLWASENLKKGKKHHG